MPGTALLGCFVSRCGPDPLCALGLCRVRSFAGGPFACADEGRDRVTDCSGTSCRAGSRVIDCSGASCRAMGRVVDCSGASCHALGRVTDCSGTSYRAEDPRVTDGSGASCHAKGQCRLVRRDGCYYASTDALRLIDCSRWWNFRTLVGRWRRLLCFLLGERSDRGKCCVRRRRGAVGCRRLSLSSAGSPEGEVREVAGVRDRVGVHAGTTGVVVTSPVPLATGGSHCRWLW